MYTSTYTYVCTYLGKFMHISVNMSGLQCYINSLWVLANSDLTVNY